MAFRRIREYFSVDEDSLEVFRKHFYNLPIYGMVYLDTSPRHLPITLIYLSLMVVLYAMHIPLGIMNLQTLFSISFTWAAFYIQIVLLMLLSILLIIFLNLERNKINILSKVLFKIFEYEEGQEEFIKRLYVEKKQELMKLLSAPAFTVIGAGSLLVQMSYINSAFGSFTYNGPELSEISWSLPIPLTTYYWSLETSFAFYSVCFFQILVAIYTVMAIIGAAMIVIVFGQMLCFHIKHLIYSMENLDVRVEAMMAKEFTEILNFKKSEISMEYDSCYIYCYKACMKKCVQHHQLIIRLVNLYQDIISFPVGFAYSTGSLVIALNLSILHTGSSLPGTLLSCIFLCIAQILYMFLFSTLGQSISDLGDLLHFKVYDTYWESSGDRRSAEVRLALRQDFLIMQEMCSRSLQAKGFGLISVSHDTFATVMNTAYSYYNLMMAF